MQEKKIRVGFTSILVEEVWSGVKLGYRIELMNTLFNQKDCVSPENILITSEVVMEMLVVAVSALF